MTEQNETNVCECCDQWVRCSNISMAMKILEAAIKHTTDPLLVSRFQDLSLEITSHGYHFPDAVKSCELTHAAPLLEALTEKLQKLLYDIRTQSKIS